MEYDQTEGSEKQMVKIDFCYRDYGKDTTMEIDVNSTDCTVPALIEQLNDKWTKWVTSVLFMHEARNNIFRVPRKFTNFGTTGAAFVVIWRNSTLLTEVKLNSFPVIFLTVIEMLKSRYTMVRAMLSKTYTV